MTTAPFDPAVAGLLSATHEQTFTATATAGGTTYELEVTDWSLSWDENRAPRVVAELQCVVPDQDVIDALDPRTNVTVCCTAGYRLPNGSWDTQDVAPSLHLRERVVDRPEDVMRLTAASSEALVIDNSSDVPFYEGTTVHSDAVSFIRTAITARLAGGPFADPTYHVTYSDPPDTSTTIEVQAFPTDWWSLVVDVADSIDVDVYDNGDDVIHIDPRRYVVARSALALTVGTNGTILRSSAGLSREDWANGVVVLWRWDNTSNPGEPDRTWGQAYVTGGPFDPAASGYRTYSETRDGQVTDSTATKVARTLLRRFLARARTYSVHAVSAWWVRPGDTVTIQLPTGAQERHLVAAVTFNPDASMDLTTRLPDNQSVIGE